MRLPSQTEPVERRASASSISQVGGITAAHLPVHNPIPHCGCFCHPDGGCVCTCV
jgi:hypothetical protein